MRCKLDSTENPRSFEKYRTLPKAKDVNVKPRTQIYFIEAFGDEDLEIIHRSGTEARLLGIYNFPGAVYATDGSNDRGVMGAGFFLLNEHRGGCCQLGQGIEGNSSNRAELGAACLALEDTTNQQDRKPVILLSDSACFLSSSQKWTGEGKSPSMHGNPDADIMRDIVRLLRERIDHGLLTIFINDDDDCFYYCKK